MDSKRIETDLMNYTLTVIPLEKPLNRRERRAKNGKGAATTNREMDDLLRVSVKNKWEKNPLSYDRWMSKAARVGGVPTNGVPLDLLRELSTN